MPRVRDASIRDSGVWAICWRERSRGEGGRWRGGVGINIHVCMYIYTLQERKRERATERACENTCTRETAQEKERES